MFSQIIYNRGQLCEVYEIIHLQLYHQKCKWGDVILPCVFWKTCSLSALKVILAFLKTWEEDFSKWQADWPRSKDSQNVTSCKHSWKIRTTGQLFLLLYLTWFKCCDGGGRGWGWVSLLIEIYLGEYTVQSEHHSPRWQVFQKFSFQPWTYKHSNNNWMSQRQCTAAAGHRI